MNDLKLDIKGGIECIGLARVIAEVGLDQVIAEVGLERVIRAVGPDAVREILRRFEDEG